MNEELKIPVTVAYDVGTVPDGIDIDMVLEVWEDERILFYDGSQGQKPYILVEDELIEDAPAFIDVTTKEGEKTFKEYKTKI